MFSVWNVLRFSSDCFLSLARFFRAKSLPTWYFLKSRLKSPRNVQLRSFDSIPPRQSSLSKFYLSLNWRLIGKKIYSSSTQIFKLFFPDRSSNFLMSHECCQELWLLCFLKSVCLSVRFNAFTDWYNVN